MLVTVVICTHSRYADFVDAVESLHRQSYDDVEIVAVVDGNERLYEDVVKYVDVDKVVLNERVLGLSESRNRGVKVASGDVVAFMDDDAVADKKWVEELVREEEFP